MVFDNRTGDPSLDSLSVRLADRITTGLSQVGQIAIVADPGFAMASKAGPAAGPGANALRELALRTGAGLVIAGAIYASGPELELQGRLVEPVQGRQIYAIDPARGPLSSLDPVIEALRQRILGAVAAYYDDMVFDLAVMRPPTFEAYQEVKRSSELWGSDYDGAVAHLKRARQLDPECVHILRRLFSAYWNQRNFDEAARQLAAWESLRSGMTPFERLDYESRVASLAGRWPEALAAYRQMNELSPRLGWVRVSRAVGELDLNRPQAAIRTLDTFTRTDLERSRTGSIGWTFQFRARAHHLLGEYEAELADARAGRASLPSDLFFHAHEAAALAALGRIAEVERVIEEAQTVQARQGTGTPLEVMWTAAAELRAHGHREASLRLANRAVERLRALPPDERKKTSTRETLRYFLFLAERWAQAQEIDAELAKERPENIDDLGCLGSLAVRLGRQAEARRIEAELAALTQPYLYGGHTYLRACIAAQLGEKERAVALLREALSQGFSDWYTIQHDLDFEPLHGYPPFEELIKPKG